MLWTSTETRGSCKLTPVLRNIQTNLLTVFLWLFTWTTAVTPRVVLPYSWAGSVRKSRLNSHVPTGASVCVLQVTVSQNKVPEPVRVCACACLRVCVRVSARVIMWVSLCVIVRDSRLCCDSHSLHGRRCWRREWLTTDAEQKPQSSEMLLWFCSLLYLIQIRSLVSPKAAKQSKKEGVCSGTSSPHRDREQLPVCLHQQGLVLRWNAAWLTVRLVCLVTVNYCGYFQKAEQWRLAGGADDVLFCFVCCVFLMNTRTSWHPVSSPLYTWTVLTHLIIIKL